MNLKPTEVKPYVQDMLEWSKMSDQDKALEEARFKYINKPPKLTEKERQTLLKRKYFDCNNPKLWSQYLFEKVVGDSYTEQALQSLPITLQNSLDKTTVMIGNKMVNVEDISIAYYLLNFNQKLVIKVSSKDELYKNYDLNRIDFERVISSVEKNVVVNGIDFTVYKIADPAAIQPWDSYISTNGFKALLVLPPSAEKTSQTMVMQQVTERKTEPELKWIEEATEENLKSLTNDSTVVILLEQILKSLNDMKSDAMKGKVQDIKKQKQQRVPISDPLAMGAFAGLEPEVAEEVESALRVGTKITIAAAKNIILAVKDSIMKFKDTLAKVSAVTQTGLSGLWKTIKFLNWMYIFYKYWNGGLLSTIPAVLAATCSQGLQSYGQSWVLKAFEFISPLLGTALFGGAAVGLGVAGAGIAGFMIYQSLFGSIANHLNTQSSQDRNQLAIAPPPSAVQNIVSGSAEVVSSVALVQSLTSSSIVQESLAQAGSDVSNLLAKQGGYLVWIYEKLRSYIGPIGESPETQATRQVLTIQQFVKVLFDKTGVTPTLKTLYEYLPSMEQLGVVAAFTAIGYLAYSYLYRMLEDVLVTINAEVVTREELDLNNPEQPITEVKELVVEGEVVASDLTKNIENETVDKIEDLVQHVDAITPGRTRKGFSEKAAQALYNWISDQVALLESGQGQSEKSKILYNILLKIAENKKSANATNAVRKMLEALENDTSNNNVENQLVIIMRKRDAYKINARLYDTIKKKI